MGVFTPNVIGLIFGTVVGQLVGVGFLPASKGFTEPLPTIRIPLRPHDQDIPLQLQPLVDAAYVNGRYADEIDYRSDPKPPLDNENAAWVDAHLRELGLR